MNNQKRTQKSYFPNLQGFDFPLFLLSMNVNNSITIKDIAMKQRRIASKQDYLEAANFLWFHYITINSLHCTENPSIKKKVISIKT